MVNSWKFSGLRSRSSFSALQPGSRALSRAAFIEKASNALTVTTTAVILISNPNEARALPDCYTDCNKNCIKQAPGSKDYCEFQCRDYCAQDDRRDGLSGSVSSEGGEVGWRSGFYQQGTIVQGDDNPPVIPGFKKLIDGVDLKRKENL
ncbi:unnamed protein product [Heterosigma akashiwo]